MFVLPDFTDDGLLPPGLHRASWDEVVGRFGFSAQRQRLLRGLREAGTNLRDAGARHLWLDGSFTTSKAEPSDFDCAWAHDGVDLSKIDPVLIDPVDIRNGRLRQKAKYFGEFLVGTERGSGMPFQLFFQQSKDGTAKGIVLLDLRTLP
ncbi:MULTISPECIES: DUF6932 family protein [Streptosporangium]|uniref:Uncharacterized protein n=1 Tax=Streptosporangium brasiliense TaxID=47480 RepID=A0ABT9R6K5_9ACTN|nr:hypothetical protein [Streptosporangium brasiliense]MDP9864879.1 hypothetical protein [Streptosporangium brasiliense]